MDTVQNGPPDAARTGYGHALETEIHQRYHVMIGSTALHDGPEKSLGVRAYGQRSGRLADGVDSRGKSEKQARAH
jgi:hypothetical protein